MEAHLRGRPDTEICVKTAGKPDTSRILMVVKQ